MDEFTERRRLVAQAPARSLAALEQLSRATPACAIAIRKGVNERRYMLHPEAPGYWVGEVWFGAARHRRHRVAGVHAANGLRDQFVRELRDLLVDGWTDNLTAPASTPP